MSLAKVFGLIVFVVLHSVSSGSRERIALRDISALTFHHGELTRTIHGRSIQQLQCVGGSASDYIKYHPRSVQCYNRGFDGRDVQWECKAELDRRVRFGKTNVNCEGYSFPDDEYVVPGSCGLEYDLHFVAGHKKHQMGIKIRNALSSTLLSLNPYLPLVSLLILAVIIWFCCLRRTYDETERSSSQHFAYDGGATPVPPSAPYPSEDPPGYEEATRGHFTSGDYTFRQRSAPYPEYGFPTTAPDPPRRYSHRKTSSESSSWLSNGLAAGAGFLGGYFFGSRDRSQHHTPTSSRRDRPYPEFVNSDSYDINVSPTRCDRSSRSNDESPYVATTFATTSRR